MRYFRRFIEYETDRYVIRRNIDDKEAKAEKLYIESCKICYEWCNCGLHKFNSTDGKR